MLTFAYYLLKVIICSGILYAYYLLALRNKIFHRWNRFYLLAIVILSLAAPVIKINIWQNKMTSNTQIVPLLIAVNRSDKIVFEYSKNKDSFNINTSDISLIVYAIFSTTFLFFLMKTLLKINMLTKNNKISFIESIKFINTNVEGTPFSFFNTIFWNDKIDINKPTGKQIFNHEVAHVYEKHSYDKLFMNIVLIIFWCNPVFWLIRKESNMIHEFIADETALKGYDTAAFASMILQTTYPQHQFNITNNFFCSSIKRRLAMISKSKNSRITYISRLLILPVIASVFLAFTLQIKTINTKNAMVDLALNNVKIGNKILEKKLPSEAYQDTSKKSKNNSVRRVYSDTNAKDVITLNSDTIIFSSNTYKGIVIFYGKIFKGEKLKNKILQNAHDVKIYAANNLDASALYGKVAKNGVIVITDGILTDNTSTQRQDANLKPDKVFSALENEAQFPGVPQSWIKYIQTIIQKNGDLLIKDHNQGIYLVQFIVDEKGNVSDVKALTMENSKLAEVSINAITQGPKWEPAKQNNHFVSSYKKQPITFKMDDNIDGNEPL